MALTHSNKQPSFSAYEFADLCYHFATLFKNNSTLQSDYGTGDVYTSLEVHTVSRIEDNPGITVTEIAEQTGRTKGAVSQILTKLESKGLVRREKDPQNPRRVCLYVTPDGHSRCQRPPGARQRGGADRCQPGKPGCCGVIPVLRR